MLTFILILYRHRHVTFSRCYLQTDATRKLETIFSVRYLVRVIFTCKLLIPILKTHQSFVSKIR